MFEKGIATQNTLFFQEAAPHENCIIRVRVIGNQVLNNSIIVCSAAEDGARKTSPCRETLHSFSMIASLSSPGTPRWWGVQWYFQPSFFQTLTDSKLVVYLFKKERLTELILSDRFLTSFSFFSFFSRWPSSTWPRLFDMKVWIFWCCQNLRLVGCFYDRRGCLWLAQLIAWRKLFVLSFFMVSVELALRGLMAILIEFLFSFLSSDYKWVSNGFVSQEQTLCWRHHSGYRSYSRGRVGTRCLCFLVCFSTRRPIICNAEWSAVESFESLCILNKQCRIVEKTLQEEIILNGCGSKKNIPFWPTPKWSMPPSKNWVLLRGAICWVVQATPTVEPTVWAAGGFREKPTVQTKGWRDSGIRLFWRPNKYVSKWKGIITTFDMEKDRLFAWRSQNITKTWVRKPCRCTTSPAWTPLMWLDRQSLLLLKNHVWSVHKARLVVWSNHHGLRV